MKKIRIACLALVLTLAMAMPAFAGSVGFNGSTLNLPADTQVVSGQTLVSAVWLGQLLGMDVSLDEGGKTVTLQKNAVKVEMTAGNKTAKVNGRSRSLKAAPVLEKTTILVPLKATAEYFGAKVSYDKAKNQAEVKYAEVKDGKTPADYLADSSIAMQKLQSYSYSGYLNMNVDMESQGQSMNMAMSALLNGAALMPDQVYSKAKLVMPAPMNDGTDVIVESYVKGSEMYMRNSADGQWEKLDVKMTPEMMASSMTQNPQQIKAMMDKYGVASSFGTDRTAGGMELVVVNTHISPESLQQMMQEMAKQTGEKLDSAEVTAALSKMNFDLGVRSYIDKATMYTEWADIFGTVVMEDNGVTLKMEIKGMIDNGKFDEAVTMPVVE